MGLGVVSLLIIIFNGALLSLCKIEYGNRTIDSMLSYNKDYSDLTSNIVEREPKITPLNKGLK